MEETEESSEALGWDHQGEAPQGWRGGSQFPHRPSGRCAVTVMGEEIALSFSDDGDLTPYGQLSIARSARAGKSGPLVTELEVTLGRRRLFHHEMEQSAGGTLRTEWIFERPIRGLHRAIITSMDGVTAVATVDGRTSLPFLLDSSTPFAFADGGAAPAVRLSRPLQKAVAALIEESGQEAAACWERKLRHGHVREEAGAPSPGGAGDVDPNFDPGHVGDVPFSAPCFLELAGCERVWEACVGVLAWASTLCGPWAGACTIGSIAACTTAWGLCHDGIARGPACCPRDCGSSFMDYECCAEGETCLNANANLCCSPGHAPCRGAECCAEGKSCCRDPVSNTDQCCQGEEFCSPVGCCTTERVCGETCCGDSEVCFAPLTSTCCARGQLCGSACCATDPLGTPVELCADPSQSLCCPLSAAVCAGSCCAIGEVCTPDGCAQPPDTCSVGLCPAGQSDCDAIPSDTPLLCLNGCCILVPT